MDTKFRHVNYHDGFMIEDNEASRAFLDGVKALIANQYPTGLTVDDLRVLDKIDAIKDRVVADRATKS
jgi:hypothetical protein